MSRYAFDLDGTLDSPSVAHLARDLYEAGHEVHIVTGWPYERGEWTMEARKEKLSRLGVPYTEIHRAKGPEFSSMAQEKARICLELGAVLMFEDMAGFIRSVGKHTRCCFVVNDPDTFGMRPIA